MSDLIIFTEVTNDNKAGIKRKNADYHLNEVVVNRNHIVAIRGDDHLKVRLVQNGWLEEMGLDERVSFCRLVLNTGSDHSTSLSVVGDLDMVMKKVKSL